MKTLLIILCLLTNTAVLEVSAQCNSKLVEKAAAVSGKETVVIREFKVKLEEGSMDKPLPVGRYAVMLNEGIHYRIALANSDISEGRGVVQLYDKTVLLGSTYNVESDKDSATFDFMCAKTKTYQVLAFFREGKPGCMAAVLSMILPDSSAFSETSAKPLRDILYIGIDNPLFISASNTEKNSMKVSIDQGSIESSEEEYLAWVSKEGSAIVYVDLLDSAGNIIETDSTVFEVKSLPLPVMSIAGKQSGTIGRHEIMNAKSIELWIPDIDAEKYYTIVEYSLVTERSDHEGISVAGNQILPRQKEKLLSLPENTAFYLINTIVRSHNGSTCRLPTQTFWLGW